MTATTPKPPPTAAGAALPPPTATPKANDARTGFALVEQQIAISASSPTLADGTPLTAPDSTGKPVVNGIVTAETFSYGALLYRIDALGAVDIFNGKLFTPEVSFDFTYPDLRATELAFDATSNTWTGSFMLSSVATLDPTFVPTNPGTLRPRYGFLTVLRIPRKASPGPTAISVGNSPLGSAFGVIATADTMAVKLGPLQASVSVQDMTKADGFAIVAKDNALVPVASLVLSANDAVPAGMTVQVWQSGSLRASLVVGASGDVTLTSATQVAIDASIVTVNGELRAQNIRYKPYDGSPEKYLI
ncbi:MAG: hypothetical protein WB810_02545 [Candidatus Cybelea sp.]